MSAKKGVAHEKDWNQREEDLAAKLQQEQLRVVAVRRENIHLAQRERDSYLANMRALLKMPASGDAPNGKGPNLGADMDACLSEPSTSIPVDQDTCLSEPSTAEVSDCPTDSRMRPGSCDVKHLDAPVVMPTCIPRASRKSVPRTVLPPMRALLAEEELLVQSLLKQDFKEMKRQFKGKEPLWQKQAQSDRAKQTRSLSVTQREAELKASLERLDNRFREVRQREELRAGPSVARCGSERGGVARFSARERAPPALQSRRTRSLNRRHPLKRYGVVEHSCVVANIRDHHAVEVIPPNVVRDMCEDRESLPLWARVKSSSTGA